MLALIGENNEENMNIYDHMNNNYETDKNLYPVVRKGNYLRCNEKSWNKYIAYFDNNSTYHFMAQYSIMPRSAAESPHINKTFSTQCGNVTLSSRKPISDNVISENDGNYQVALEINLEKLPDQEKIYVIEEKNIKEVNIKEYKEQHRCKLIAFNNIIPFEAIEVIFLKSKEDKDHFISGPSANIKFEHFNIQVKPEIFEGEQLSLEEDILNKISRIETKDKYIKRVNHIRAALLASLMSTNLPVTNSIATSYDKKMIKILANHTSQNNERHNFDYLNDIANKKLIEEGYKPMESILDDDNTPLNECLWLNEQVNRIAKGELDEPEYLRELDKNSKNREEMLDIYSFRVLCWLLINIEDFKPLEFVDQFKKEFNDNIKDLSVLENSDLSSDISSIAKTYDKHFDKLKTNLKGASQSASNSRQQHYSTFIALNHFGMSHEPSDHFDSLVKYLESKPGINDYHRRLVWFLYGLCYGMHRVNKDYKERLNNLFLIDNLFFYRKDCIGNLNSAHNELVIQNDGLCAIFNVIKEYGDLEDLINELKNKDEGKKIEDIMLNLDYFPEEYKLYRTTFKGLTDETKIDWNNNIIVCISDQKPYSEEEINWKKFNIKEFISKIKIEDKKSLSRKLTSYIYGDSYGH